VENRSRKEVHQPATLGDLGQSPTQRLHEMMMSSRLEPVPESAASTGHKKSTGSSFLDYMKGRGRERDTTTATQERFSIRSFAGKMTERFSKSGKEKRKEGEASTTPERDSAEMRRSSEEEEFVPGSPQALEAYHRAFQKGKDLLKDAPGRPIDIEKTKHFEQRYKEEYTDFGDGIYHISIHLRGDDAKQMIYDAQIDTRARTITLMSRYKDKDKAIWKEKGLQAENEEANVPLPHVKILVHQYREVHRRELEKNATGYQSGDGGEIEPPEKVEIVGITTKETLHALCNLVEKNEEKEFAKGSDGYHVAIGTPNARSSIRMVLDDYPQREISHVEVYRYPGGNLMDMKIYFGDKNS
jgi:hypothetical protein